MVRSRSSSRTRRVQVAPQQPTQPPPSTQTNVLRTSRCVKYTMFFKNLFFLVCGVLLAAIGGIALHEKDKLNGKFDNLFLDPAAIVLSVGILTFVISFCGALGALRENKCLLRFFYIFVIIIMIVQLSIAVVFYAYREKIRNKIDDVFQEMIVKYYDDPDLQTVIDYVQKEVKCCGSTGLEDWLVNPYFNCSNKGIASACSVPYSCCKSDKLNRQCGRGILKLLSEADQGQKVYTIGCLEALEKWFLANITYAGVVFGCLFLLQVIAVRLAFSLISDINEIIKWRDSHI